MSLGSKEKKSSLHVCTVAVYVDMMAYKRIVCAWGCGSVHVWTWGRQGNEVSKMLYFVTK